MRFMAKSLLIGGSALVAILFATSVYAGSVQLTWEAPTTRVDETALPAEEIGGYNVYYGTASGVYTTTIDTLSTSLSYTVTGLNDNTLYYFVVTAYDTGTTGSVLESSYSNEVSKANYVLTISKAGTGAGTVTSSPAGINCGGTCSYAYDLDTVVTLTANPNTGSTFTSWTGDADCSDASVTMSTAVACTATFTLNQYTVTPSAGANGSISPNTPQTVGYNLTTAFTVTPDTGYEISSVTGCSGSGTSTYTTGAITGNCTVTASFTPISYTLTASVGANGTLFIGATPFTSTYAADYGTQVVVTALPDGTYQLADMSGCGGTLSIMDLTIASVTGDCTVTASFQAPAGDTTPPAQVTGLIARYHSSSSIKLVWTASSDDTAVEHYHIHRCTGAGCTNFAYIGEVDDLILTYTDTGLTSTTTYRYMVTAHDAATNTSINSASVDRKPYSARRRQLLPRSVR